MSNESNNIGIKAERTKDPQALRKRTIKTSNKMIVTFMVFINFILTVFLAIWIYSFSDNQFQAGKGLIEKISLIENQMKEERLFFKDNFKNIDVHLNLIDKEVRKLWDLSNKKNKTSIALIKNQIEIVNKGILEFEDILNGLSAKFRTRDLEAKGFNKSINNLKKNFNKLSSDLSKESNNKRIDSLEASIKAIDGFRVKINKGLFDIRTRMDEVELDASERN